MGQDNRLPNDKLDTLFALDSSDKLFMLLSQLVRVAHELDHDVSSKLSQFDLSNGKLKVLAILQKYEGPLNPSQIADFTGVTRSTITGLLDGLENEHYITRSTLKDRRRTAIHITEKGREVINTLSPYFITHINNIFSKLTKEDQDNLMKLLERIRNGVQYAKDHNPFPT